MFAANDWISVGAAISAIPLRLKQIVDQLLVVPLRVVLVVQHLTVGELNAGPVAVIRGLAARCFDLGTKKLFGA